MNKTDKLIYDLFEEIKKDFIKRNKIEYYQNLIEALVKLPIHKSILMTFLLIYKNNRKKTSLPGGDYYRGNIHHYGKLIDELIVEFYREAKVEHTYSS